MHKVMRLHILLLALCVAVASCSEDASGIPVQILVGAIDKINELGYDSAKMGVKVESEDDRSICLYFYRLGPVMGGAITICFDKQTGKYNVTQTYQ